MAVSQGPAQQETTQLAKLIPRNRSRSADNANVDIRPTKGSILAALSLALDLVEGQPEGHSLRTCRIAIRIGRDAGLDDTQLNHLFYAALLKDTGCSNNSVRIHNIFGGDDLVTKSRVKFIDWTSSFESVKFALFNMERGSSIGLKLRRMAANVGPPTKVMRAVTEARCTRGAEIARMLGFGDDVSSAVRDLDEHWDGRGAPRGVHGDAIPVFARILCLAQTFEVFLSAFGLDTAYDMLQKRSGSWFDPELAAVMSGLRSDATFWWDYFDRAYSADADLEVPGGDTEVMGVDLDRICDAFGMIVDAKSGFTWDHSVRVAHVAIELADYFDFNAERRSTLRRAALLHDIGKLGIATSILEKPGRLEPEELTIMQQHPRHSFEILNRVPTFKRIAEISSGHHERLDGNGYWRRVGADQLDLDTRILAASDVFDALSTKRPYKEALPLDQVLGIMESDSGTGLDPECVTALRELTQSWQRVAA